MQLEWNPWSVASRAARAERGGRYAEALRLYARDRRGESRVLDTLSHGLPQWPIRHVIIAAARDLLYLQRAVDAARAAKVPPAILNGVAEGADRAAEIVWRSADRLAAAGAQRVDATFMLPTLKAETDRLEDLRTTILALRTELAEVTVSGTPATADRDAARHVSVSLRALTDATRALRESIDEV
ncbi:MAG TPA: hypothetical protein VII06_03935 [Chloroflexota bacterium]|jgi:hypothetical protein